MVKLEYCKSWFWANRSTSNPLSEKTARKRHDERKEYTVVVGGFEQPTTIVEVVGGFVPVTFLDRLLRREMTLHFEELEPHRLHLTMASRRKYAEVTEEMVERIRTGRADPKHNWGQFLAEIDWVLDGRSIIFKPDGSTICRAGRHGDARILEVPGPYFDASGHAEHYPEFGHYDHLLKRDRVLPWGPGLDGL